MSRVDEMRNARDEKPVVYYNFIKNYEKHRDEIFCFHEGKMDDKYYGSKIDTICGPKFYMYCKGKRNVLYMKKVLSENSTYSGKKFLFFVDRDFDRRINDDSVFETPCYSIENLYVGEDTLAKILRREFYILDDDVNFNNIMQLFQDTQSEFHEQIKNFNVWLFYQRRQELEKMEKRRINLDNFDGKQMKKLILIDEDFHVQVKCTTIQEIEELFNQYYPLNEEIMEKIKRKIDISSASKWFRGKQEFFFFCLFLDKIIERYSLCKKGKSDVYPFIYQKNMCEISINVTSKNEQLMQPLSCYARTPDELIDYVNRQCS